MEKPLVLLADDNDATCTLVTAVLQRDFAVETVSDGQQAVEKLRHRQYQVVLLDLRMPVLDGFGVLEFLLREREDLLGRVLILTAALSHKEMERVRTFPICGVIAKPFDVETLLTTVKDCAGQTATSLRGPLLTSGMILLLAEFVRGRWL